MTTIDYYNSNASAYAHSTMSADMTDAYLRFLPLLPAHCRILDLGSGSGRDAAAFSLRGYSVTALEPSSCLCDEIRSVFHGEVICSSIQFYRPSAVFDGIWANASLLHLCKEDFLSFFRDIDDYLADGGFLYLSGKYGIPKGYDENGRFFLPFSEQLLQEALAVQPKLSCRALWYSGDKIGRSVRWMNIILQKQMISCCNSG